MFQSLIHQGVIPTEPATTSQITDIPFRFNPLFIRG